MELGKSIARSISLAKEELDFEFNYDSGFIPKNLKQHLSVGTKDGIKHFIFGIRKQIEKLSYGEVIIKKN